MASRLRVVLLDYGGGNVRSVRNALRAAALSLPAVAASPATAGAKVVVVSDDDVPSTEGDAPSPDAPECMVEVSDLRTPSELDGADAVVFPGVGSFGAAMEALTAKGLVEPLRRYLSTGKPFLGICLGLQTLFESSEESPGVAGLGVIPGTVQRFPASDLSVPHIGWNGVRPNPDRVDASTDATAAAAAAVGDAAAGSEAVSSAAAAPSVTSSLRSGDKVYFVHSFRAVPADDNREWVLTLTDYGRPFVSSVQRGLVCATQFHPEKSGATGLRVLATFLAMASGAAASDAGSERAALVARLSEAPAAATSSAGAGEAAADSAAAAGPTQLARRIVACLDVRSNDDGDLVVTKGDQYDVREAAPASDDSTAAAAAGSHARGDVAGAGAAATSATGAAAAKGSVRNLGKPVDLARRYYREGADEVVFLNICAFRGEPLNNLPMLGVLEQTSSNVYVPLTIGGGIRDYTDAEGRKWSALDVAARYFRAGADKVSIGSDAVYAAEAYYARIAAGASKEAAADGTSCLETISHVYGAQAVVVSVDPRRVYVASPEDAPAGIRAIETAKPGPGGERYVWYQCTVKGGREGRVMDTYHLAQAVEALGAGELLVNCVDNDGQKGGFDLELLRDVCSAVSIPVIASSGAGVAKHFSDVFAATRCEAALAAGIFHRHEVEISDVKEHLAEAKVVTRRVAVLRDEVSS